MGGLGVIMAFASCTTHYQLTTIDRSRILIDQRYDVRQDTKAVAFLAPYKHQVDSIMGPVVAHSHHYMKAERPESDLSNLLADIMVWGRKPTMKRLISQSITWEASVQAYQLATLPMAMCWTSHPLKTRFVFLRSQVIR